MPAWECAIGGCGRRFDDPESVLAHQAEIHDRHECRICGTSVPEGFFAIRHAFEEHSRADYVRFYGGDADAIRRREEVKEQVEASVDVEAAAERLDASGPLADADG